MENRGIKNIDIVYFLNSFSLKTDYLYFDKLIYNEDLFKESKIIGEWFSKSVCDKTGELFNKNMAELELLEKNGMLAAFKSIELNSQDECYNLQTQTDFIKLFNELMENDKQRYEWTKNLKKSNNISETFKNIIESSMQSADLNSIISSLLFNFKNDYVVPIIQNKSRLTQNAESKAIINLVIKKFPYIDFNIEWKKIFEFKKDEESKYRLKALKNWVIDISKNNYSLIEIEQKLEFLIEQYERQIRLHKLKVRYFNLDLILSSTIATVENIIKLNISELGKNRLSLKKEEINLLLEKENIEGNEVAYISNIIEQFDNKQNRMIRNAL